jgi:hypothetical protein
MPNLNPKTTTIDYDAARVRLEAVTAHRDVLEGFDRNAQRGDIDDAFLAALDKRSLSLDYIFLGRGEPFMSEAL